MKFIIYKIMKVYHIHFKLFNFKQIRYALSNYQIY